MMNEVRLMHFMAGAICLSLKQMAPTPIGDAALQLIEHCTRSLTLMPRSGCQNLQQISLLWLRLFAFSRA